jgi:hypothetical protein
MDETAATPVANAKPGILIADSPGIRDTAGVRDSRLSTTSRGAKALGRIRYRQMELNQ